MIMSQICFPKTQYMWLVSCYDSFNIKLLIAQEGGSLVPICAGDALAPLPPIPMDSVGNLVQLSPC